MATNSNTYAVQPKHTRSARDISLSIDTRCAIDAARTRKSAAGFLGPRTGACALWNLTHILCSVFSLSGSRWIDEHSTWGRNRGLNPKIIKGVSPFVWWFNRKFLKMLRETHGWVIKRILALIEKSKESVSRVFELLEDKSDCSNIRTLWGIWVPICVEKIVIERVSQPCFIFCG